MRTSVALCLLALPALAPAQPARRGRAREPLRVEGPFRDDAAYCAPLAQGTDEACRSPYSPDENRCGCDLDGDAPAGVRQLPAPQGPLRAARLVRITRDVHELDPCVLLVETPRGTFALPGVGTCGEPRIAHDYTITTTVGAMSAAPAPGGGAVLTIRLREREDRADYSEVGGPRGTSSEARATVTVRVSAAGDVVSALRSGRR